jgi:hypothetical protein
MTLQNAVEVELPIEQAGARLAPPPEPTAPDGQAPEMPSETDNAPPIPSPDSQEYEDEVTERIRKNAPMFIAQDKKAKLSTHIAKELKSVLAYDLALLKAIKVGKGRDGEWGDLLKELDLARSTVDRWVEKKFLNGELPPWAEEKLKNNKHEDPDLDENEEDVEDVEEAEAKTIMRFSENRLECVIPFTADEKAVFIKYFCLLTAEEAKYIFIEAIRVAAEAKRGQGLADTPAAEANDLGALIQRVRGHLQPEETPQRKSHAFLDDVPCDVGNLVTQPQLANAALAEGELR